MAFHDVQFPTAISYGSVGGPEYNTDVVELSNAHEQRNQNWTYPRERWDVAFGVKAKADLQALATFFHVRRGMLHSFRFKSHDDFQANGQDIGDGDGSDTTFQLVKIYTSGAYTLTRIITKPVAGTVVVYVDALDVGSAFSVDTDTGIVTLDVPPVSGEVVTADFDFDIHARFDTDHLPQNFADYEARSASVPVLELRL